MRVTNPYQPGGQVELREFGEDAEARVAHALALARAPDGNPGYDAIDATGRRWQIKARRVTPHGTLYRPIGQAGTLDAFDVLLVAVFEPTGNQIVSALQADSSVVRRHARVNGSEGWSVTLASLRADHAIVDLTNRLLESPSFQCDASTAPFRLRVDEPWQMDPGRFGRVRLTRPMSEELLETLFDRLDALHAQRLVAPNPSDEGQALMARIRLLQKVRNNLMGMMEEKGWLDRGFDAPR